VFVASSRCSVHITISRTPLCNPHTHPFLLFSPRNTALIGALSGTHTRFSVHSASRPSRPFTVPSPLHLFPRLPIIPLCLSTSRPPCIQPFPVDRSSTLRGNQRPAPKCLVIEELAPFPSAALPPSSRTISGGPSLVHTVSAGQTTAQRHPTKTE
jgi:hypothetical protein